MIAVRVGAVEPPRRMKLFHLCDDCLSVPTAAPTLVKRRSSALDRSYLGISDLGRNAFRSADAV